MQRFSIVEGSVLHIANIDSPIVRLQRTRAITPVILFVSLVLFISSSAHALTIRNIDYEPRTLIITSSGERSEITIPPRGVYRTLGVSFVIEKPGQKPRNALRNEEYMIYKDVLYLQRRDSRPGDNR